MSFNLRCFSCCLFLQMKIDRRNPPSFRVQIRDKPRVGAFHSGRVARQPTNVQHRNSPLGNLPAAKDVSDVSHASDCLHLRNQNSNMSISKRFPFKNQQGKATNIVKHIQASIRTRRPGCRERVKSRWIHGQADKHSKADIPQKGSLCLLNPEMAGSPWLSL